MYPHLVCIQPRRIRTIFNVLILTYFPHLICYQVLLNLPLNYFLSPSTLLNFYSHHPCPTWLSLGFVCVCVCVCAVDLLSALTTATLIIAPFSPLPNLFFREHPGWSSRNVIQILFTLPLNLLNVSYCN